jgi:hypothetical protein
MFQSVYRDQSMDMLRDKLRLNCRSGGHYWIALNGRQVRRGKTLTKADELQPKFIDAMERAGR